jgi:hypothetical protein
MLNWWDAVSVHPYRKSGPETTGADFRKLRRLITQYAPKDRNIPVLAGEWGYSAGWENFDPEEQGKMLPRELLMNVADDIPLSIWYDWHDGHDPKDPEHHFGTVKFEYQAGRIPVYDAKPAYFAAQTLTSVLGGYRFTKRIATASPDDYALLFHKGDELRLVVWSTAPPHQLKLPSSRCTFAVVSHTGQHSTPASCNDKSLLVAVTDAPQYFIAQGANPLLANAPVSERLRVTLLPPQGKYLQARVENLSDEGFEGLVRLVDVEGLRTGVKAARVEFVPGEFEKTVRFPLVWNPGGPFRVGLRVDKDGKPILNLPTREFVPLPDDIVTDSKIVADGDPNVASEQSLALAAAPEPLPGSEAAVMRISYRLDKGWKFLRVVPLRQDLRKIPGKPTAFGIWIYGDGQETKPRLRVVDSTSQSWQPGGIDLDWKGWRYVQFELNPATVHWGGAKDDDIHFPLTWESIFLIDNPYMNPKQGTLYVAAPVVVY